MEVILSIAERYEQLSRALLGIGAMAAGISALVAIAKYFYDRRAAKVNNALQSYRAYLRMCLDWPQLAHPHLSKVAADVDEFTRYRWFVSNMLMAFEEVGGSLSPAVEKEWNAAIRLQLGFHSEYLASAQFREREFAVYTPYLRRMIDAEVSKWKSTQVAS